MYAKLLLANLFFLATLGSAQAQRYLVKEAGNYTSKASVLQKPDGSIFGLDLGIRTNSHYLGIRNYDHFAYQKVRVVLNHEYVYAGLDITPGAIASVPWSAFVKQDGTRHGEQKGALETMLISAEHEDSPGGAQAASVANPLELKGSYVLPVLAHCPFH
jgi:hypothetical protein